VWRLASLKLSTSNLVSGGNLRQHLCCLAWGCTCLPGPRLQAGDWKRDPRCFSTESPILLERTEAVLRAPSPEGKAYLSEGMDQGGYSLHLAHEGQMAERTLPAPKTARLAGPSKTGQE